MAMCKVFFCSSCFATWSMQVPVATKANPFFNSRLTRAGVLEQFSTSLARLEAPSVDLFYLHAPDHNTPIEESLQTCQQLYEGILALHINSRSKWLSTCILFPRMGVLPSY